MTTAMQLLDLLLEVQRLKDLAQLAINEERDLTRTETESLRRAAEHVNCLALALERQARGVPEPKQG